jgi:ABC-type thiamine transport system substrate-binding protein
MTRYTVKPHEHGYQVFDGARGDFCIATWTTIEATAQKWANALNNSYAAFMEQSGPVVISFTKHPVKPVTEEF